MFAKTILSVLSLGITIIGLVLFFNTGEYYIFIIGMACYFLATVSSSFFKSWNK
jgi:hypothetical protein